MKKIVKKWIASLRSNDEISQDLLSVYAYGMNILLEIAISVIITLIAAAWMGQVKEVIIVYFIVFLIRSYGGGFHFENFRSCLLVSVGFVILILIIHKYMVLSDISRFIGFNVSIGYMMVKGLTKDPNRNYAEKEEKYYNDIVRLISLIIFCAVYILARLGHNAFSRLLSITICMLALSKIAGDIRYKIFVRKHQKKGGCP